MWPRSIGPPGPRPTTDADSYLPSYVPDHNPDEFLNGDLKQKLRQKLQSGTKDEIIKTTRAVMRTIQRSPERIKSYFMAEPVKHAA